MNTHKNASMTPKGRAHLVREIDRIGLGPAAEASGLSPRTARKWHRRHAAEGVAGLLDRSSRPVRSPGRSDGRKLERAAALRRTQHLTYEHIEPVPVRWTPRSTMSVIHGRPVWSLATNREPAVGG